MEHPILEAIEFMAIIEETGNMDHAQQLFKSRNLNDIGFWGHWAQ